MHDFVVTNGQTQILIPLRIRPFTHKAVPTLTGSAFSAEAGTVLFGHYSMEYLLPGGDKLRLFANHAEKTVQLIWFTHRAELLQQLPGQHHSSLVADTISRINRYRIRSKSYPLPLTAAQSEKLKLANQCIESLQDLLEKERAISSADYSGHEKLRRDVISIIEHCNDANQLLAINPVVSEGSLGTILYDTHKAAQQFQFNRVYAVSAQDQMDFTQESTHNNKVDPCFIWDSELHIGHNSRDLDDAIRTICQAYELTPAAELNNIPANRFEQLEAFFYQLWLDGKDWIEYLSVTTKPKHQTEIQHRSDGISITKITPYYKLQGFQQKGFRTINELIFYLTQSTLEGHPVQSIQEANKLLSALPNGHWTIDPYKKNIVIRLNNQLLQLNYFLQEDLFYPLPDGEDLYTLTQVSKRHLYLPERVSLKLKAFASRIPIFFNNFFVKLRHFIMHDLHQEFVSHVHAGHQPSQEKTETKNERLSEIRRSLRSALEEHGLLNNDQTIEEFIKEQLNNSPYVIARANHPPSPHTYDNPAHRALSVLRHFAGFFIATTERNPLIGTLAMSAYLFGASAVLAPKALEGLLLKLHLNGLIAGIEPVQKLAQVMSHGTVPEAISASVTLWQSVVAGGNLDKFFVNAIGALKDDPAEIAIIVSLALSFGYSLTRIIPSLRDEMGRFPIPNYAALGGKGGAAIYDTIMHPGDDWLLGTVKWLCKGVITLGKLFVSPFVEGYYYGFKKGWVKGVKKSGALIIRLSMQTTAAMLDFALAILTIPLIEISAMLIHLPFRGISNLITKIFGTLGNISAIGEALLRFAQRPSSNNFLSEFKLSSIYGFSSPLGHFSERPIINFLFNTMRVIYIVPLQIIKNLLILPIIDLLSLTTRLFLTLINPLSRVAAYTAGHVISTVGGVWDNSLGIGFLHGARAVTIAANWIDRQCGTIKRNILSLIEILRSELYHWAFYEEDLHAHQLANDTEYFTNESGRYEKTLCPQASSHCLLQALLGEGKHATSPVEEPHFEELFAPSASNEASNAYQDLNHTLCLGA